MAEKEEDYWIYGYGSLLWRPPPHVVETVPGFIRGCVRRFWQSSIDHRGTPENPGRVATLISHSFWAELGDPMQTPEDEPVWGVAFRIDPKYAREVKEYMDEREKNGYSEEAIEFHPSVDHKPFKCSVYIGLPDNPAFTGYEEPKALAKRIVECRGPSGPNSEYLYKLNAELGKLNPSARDAHVAHLVELALDMEANLKEAPVAEAKSENE